MKIRIFTIITATVLILLFAGTAAAKSESLSLSVGTDDGKMIKGGDVTIDLLLGKSIEATSGAFSATTKQGITIKNAVWNIDNASVRTYDSYNSCGSFLNEVYNGTAKKEPVEGDVLTLTVSVSSGLTDTVKDAITVTFILQDSTRQSEEIVFEETVSISAEIVGFPHNTVIKDATDGKMYYYNDGVRDMSFTGFAENADGRWRVKNGTVDLSYTDVVRDGEEWKYYKDGKWQKTAETVAKNSNGWWYIKNGIVQFDVTSVVKRADNGTWWYVKDGKVQTGVTSVVKRVDVGSWWYVKGGKVQFDVTSVVKRADNGTWWYVKGGKVQFDATGIAERTDNKSWWYVKGGKVLFDATGLAQKLTDGKWWYVKGGKLDSSFTGITKRVDNSTQWYVKKGQAQLSYSGTVKYNGKTYTIKKGKVV